MKKTKSISSTIKQSTYYKDLFKPIVKNKDPEAIFIYCKSCEHFKDIKICRSHCLDALNQFSEKWRETQRNNCLNYQKTLPEDQRYIHPVKRKYKKKNLKKKRHADG